MFIFYRFKNKNLWDILPMPRFSPAAFKAESVPVLCSYWLQTGSLQPVLKEEENQDSHLPYLQSLFFLPLLLSTIPWGLKTVGFPFYHVPLYHQQQ